MDGFLDDRSPAEVDEGAVDEVGGVESRKGVGAEIDALAQSEGRALGPACEGRGERTDGHASGELAHLGQIGGVAAVDKDQPVAVGDPPRSDVGGGGPGKFVRCGGQSLEVGETPRFLLRGRNPGGGKDAAALETQRQQVFGLSGDAADSGGDTLGEGLSGCSDAHRVLSDPGRGRLLLEPVIALVLELEGEFAAARVDDLAIHEDVDEVGNDVVEQPLIVGDQHE